MIQLLEGGAYLLNGTELVADNSEAVAAIKAKTGKDVVKEEAAKETIAYGILADHNTSGNMEKLKIKFFPTLWSQALLLRQKRCHSPNPTAYIWLISISKWASSTGLNCAVSC